MTSYVAMLRGINVSGRNRLAMAELRALVVAVGGTGVQTYIQSGNAVFQSRRASSSLVGLLEKELESTLGSHVPVLLRTGQELASVLDSNPFVRPGHDTGSLHVTFMGAVPDPEVVVAAGKRKADRDEFQVVGREVYLLCPNGYGNTKLTNAFFEKKLGSEATTRNWKTVNKLVEMTQE